MRPTNAQLLAYVNEFQKLGRMAQCAALLDLMDYARGTGASYGILDIFTEEN